MRKGFAKTLRSSFVIAYRKMRDIVMQRRATKAKQDFSVWSSAKRCKGLQNY